MPTSRDDADDVVPFRAARAGRRCIRATRAFAMAGGRLGRAILVPGRHALVRAASPVRRRVVEFSVVALSQASARLFAVPASLGIEYRVLNGYDYVSPHSITDHVTIDRRAQLFADRGGFYAGRLQPLDRRPRSDLSWHIRPPWWPSSSRGRLVVDDGDAALDFATFAEGFLGPSADPDLHHGSVSWRIEHGDGRFHGASGLITSNFVLRPSSGEVDERQVAVVFLP
jgi:hypothetical protein